MSLPDAIAAWLAARCPAESALAGEVAQRLCASRLAGDTVMPITPAEAVRLHAAGVAAADPAVAPLTVRGAGLAWSACARDEDDLAARLLSLAAAPQTPADAAQQALIALGADAGQDAAVRLAVERRLAVIVGGPGTGKTTTVLRALVALLASHAGNVRLAAPTGKAAARLRAAVERGLAQTTIPAAQAALLARAAAEATTVHRLLGWDAGAVRFRHGPNHRLPVDIVVVDEGSMLDVHLAAALARALPAHARLILVGDDGQLPSVEAGAVLRDIVAGLPAHVARLATVHRQAGNAIGLRGLCPALRVGDAAAAEAVLAAGHDDAQRVVHAQAWARLQEVIVPWSRAVIAAGDAAAALQVLAGVLVLAATRDGPWGVADLHVRIEAALGVRVDGLEPNRAHGRPLLITANDHRLGLANGDLGVFWDDGAGLVACFADADGGVRRIAPARLPACETGWVTTVHKAQGSEAETVIAVLPPQPHPLACRELLYTAVTRARSRVVLVADLHLTAAALARRDQRTTALAGRLTELS